MIAADQVPAPEGELRVLTDDQLRAAIMTYVDNAGTAGKFFERFRPPELSGEKKDFEV